MSRTYEVLMEREQEERYAESLLKEQSVTLEKFERVSRDLLEITNLLAKSVLEKPKCRACGITVDHDSDVCAVELAMYQRGGA